MFKGIETRPIHLITHLGETADANHLGLVLFYENAEGRPKTLQVCVNGGCSNENNAKDNWGMFRFVDGPSEVDFEVQHHPATSGLLGLGNKPERTEYVVKEIRISRKHQIGQ